MLAGLAMIAAACVLSGGDRAPMKVRKAPDFEESGEWIVTYAGQTFRIYFDRSLSNSWSFAHPPGVVSARHGDDTIGIGSKAESLEKLRQMIDQDDPRLARFRFGG